MNTLVQIQRWRLLVPIALAIAVADVAVSYGGPVRAGGARVPSNYQRYQYQAIKAVKNNKSKFEESPSIELKIMLRQIPDAERSYAACLAGAVELLKTRWAKLDGDRSDFLNRIPVMEKQLPAEEAEKSVGRFWRLSAAREEKKLVDEVLAAGIDLHQVRPVIDENALARYREIQKEYLDSIADSGGNLMLLLKLLIAPKPIGAMNDLFGSLKGKPLSLGEWDALAYDRSGAGIKELVNSQKDKTAIVFACSKHGIISDANLAIQVAASSKHPALISKYLDGVEGLSYSNRDQFGKVLEGLVLAPSVDAGVRESALIAIVRLEANKKFLTSLSLGKHDGVRGVPAIYSQVMGADGKAVALDQLSGESLVGLIKDSGRPQSSRVSAANELVRRIDKLRDKLTQATTSARQRRREAELKEFEELVAGLRNAEGLPNEVVNALSTKKRPDASVLRGKLAHAKERFKNSKIDEIIQKLEARPNKTDEEKTQLAYFQSMRSGHIADIVRTALGVIYEGVEKYSSKNEGNWPEKLSDVAFHETMSGKGFHFHPVHSDKNKQKGIVVATSPVAITKGLFGAQKKKVEAYFLFADGTVRAMTQEEAVKALEHSNNLRTIAKLKEVPGQYLDQVYKQDK